MIYLSLRAGYFRFTVAWVTAVTVNPIAKGAVIIELGLFGSVTPKTTKSRMKPSMNSTPTPWAGDNVGWIELTPRVPMACDGVIPWHKDKQTIHYHLPLVRLITNIDNNGENLW